MHRSIDSPYRVASDGKFELSSCPTSPSDPVDEKKLKRQLEKPRKNIAKLQHRLYAENRNSLLLVFQAMDAGGKDSTIRHVTKGINPAGCRVNSFKQPSSEELDHDFLWRTSKQTPQRGCIGIFNRSYYEEVLVVRVHPEILRHQRLPSLPENLEVLWAERYASINAFERHMVENGTAILKFWLNVSKEEQRRRFLSRLDEPSKHWKFSVTDVKERERWDDYMHAYQAMIRATSTAHAPWFAIPADNKPYMRLTVAKIILQALQVLDPHFPAVNEKEKSRFAEMRQMLEEQ
jgi:PPK2 family polyphosphate:nucleotide phosphotransferase